MQKRAALQMLTFLIDKALTLFLEIFKSEENDKRNRQESWDGRVWWAERRLLQEGDLRALMDNAKANSHSSASGPRAGESK